MNASYDDDSKTFTICEGVLRAGSRMTLVRTIAHEIGHLVYFSLTRDQKKNLLPPDLLTCLRSAEGANAKPEEMSTRFKVYGKLSDASKEFLAGYSSEAYEDQLNEVFADYFSAEYMASVSIDGFSPKDYANAYAESVPATAIDSEPEKWARYEKESEYPFWCAHPRRSDRLNRIIMVHPGIRQRMGCPSVVAPKGRYCGALSSYF